VLPVTVSTRSPPPIDFACEAGVFGEVEQEWPGGPGQLGQSQRAVAGVEDQVRGPAADERVGVGHAHVVVNVSAGHQVRDVGDSVHVAEEFGEQFPQRGDLGAGCEQGELCLGV
jgi:hypothetical protein